MLPGDALMTTCTYDTDNRDIATLGGYDWEKELIHELIKLIQIITRYGFSEEMCVNYVHYYPRVELEVCKSDVDAKALEDYFRFSNDFDGQARKMNSTIAVNVYQPPR